MEKRTKGDRRVFGETGEISSVPFSLPTIPAGTGVTGSSGGLDTGDVFGSGNTGPFVNNILQADATINSPDYDAYQQVIAWLQSDPRMAYYVFRLQRSATRYTVHFVRGQNQTLYGDINWNRTAVPYSADSTCASPAVTLAHEIVHAALQDIDQRQSDKEFQTYDPQFGNLEDRRIITGRSAL